MYYLNLTTSRLLLLLHESKAELRTSVNNNDNLRVQWDLSGFYPIAFDVHDHGIWRSVPWKHVSILLGNGRIQLLRYREKDVRRARKEANETSLKRKPLSPLSHFNETVTEDITEQLSKGIIPKGTAKATSWAIRTFSDWIT